METEKETLWFNNQTALLSGGIYTPSSSCLASVSAHSSPLKCRPLWAVHTYSKHTPEYKLTCGKHTTCEQTLPWTQRNHRDIKTLTEPTLVYIFQLKEKKTHFYISGASKYFWSWSDARCNITPLCLTVSKLKVNFCISQAHQGFAT